MKITVETFIRGKLSNVWNVWNDPAEIKEWAAAQDDWHTTRSTIGDSAAPPAQSRMQRRIRRPT
jgi:uncharacterized protein YndB with AHSA1/START domain